MASSKELRALITLAGKVDPSLQAAMMKASKMNLNMAQGAKNASMMQNRLASSSKNAGNMLSRVGTIAKGVLVGNLLTRGVSMTVEGIKSVGGAGISLASDLTEVQNVVDTVFGASSREIDRWAKTATKNFGLSELMAKQFTGTMGAMLESSGITGKNLITMSTNLSGLAGDFASFYNLKHEEAWDKIKAGMAGETEPLRALGINMTVANLEAFALSKGIKQSWEQMDQASQTSLRYMYIMDKSKKAQGDFAKTLETSYANQKRLLTTNANQKMAQLWTKSLPVMTRGTKLLNTLVAGIDVDKLGDRLGKGISFAFDWIEKNGPGVMRNLSTIGGHLFTIGKNAWEFGLVLVNGLKPSIEKAFNWFTTTALPKLSEASTTILPNLMVAAKDIGSILEWAWPYIEKVGNFLLDTTLPTLKATSEVLRGIFETLDGILKLDFSKIGGGLTDIAKGGDTAFSKMGFLVNPAGWVASNFSKMAGEALSYKNPTISSTQKSTGYKSGKTTYGMPAYADGGFANRPSLFGEAGLEAAIPIKYRNSRSISLLNQTARAIGAEPGGSKPNMILNFNFSGPISNKNDVVSGVQMAKDYILQVIDDYLDGKGRPDFG